MTTTPPPLGQRRVAGRIAAWTAVATIGFLAVTGIALAAPTFTQATTSAASPSPSGSAGPEGKPGKADRPGKGPRPGKGNGGAHLRALGRMLHGEAVVRDKDGKFVTVYTQRGEVTAVSATSITLKSADGFVSTYAINAETKIGKERTAGEIADIKVGDEAGVVAVKSGGSKLAKGIRAGDAGDKD